MTQFIEHTHIISYIKSNHLKNYEKNTTFYSILKDKKETAIGNALWLMEQNQNDINRGVKIYNLSVYTDVHILVQKLINTNC